MNNATALFSMPFTRVLAVALPALTLFFSTPLRAADAQEIVKTLCSACHGLDGNGTDGTKPKLAGMNRDYLLKQLIAFASGKRRSEIMSPMIATVAPDDFPGLADYFSSQKPLPGKVRNNSLAAKGKSLFEEGNTDSGVPACAGCHEADGSGSARIPRLAGQHQDYILKQLANYKNRKREGSRLMFTVSQRLTENEAKAVAEYLVGL